MRRSVVALVGAALVAAPLEAQSLATVRFTVPAAAVDSVRRLGIDLVEVHPRPGGRVELVSVISPRDRLALMGRGWIPQDVPRSAQAALMEARRTQLGARAFLTYRDFDDPTRGIAAWLRAFAASHTNVTVDSIGATAGGRPILIAKVGVAGDAPSRPNVLYMATYHAREWAATEMALRLLEYLADSLPLQPGGASLLASRDVWVLPVVNPDGYQYTFTNDRLWRKNRRPNGDGSFGVDLNRNHAGFWGFDDIGSSGVPAAETYRGPSVASEPEVRAVEAFHRAHPPVASISYHTYTGAVLYPWAHVNGARTGDDAIFRGLAGTDVAPAIPDSLPGSINRYYHPGPGWQLYPTNGEYTGYAYRSFRTLAFTVELTSGCCLGLSYYGFEFPDDEALLARLARDNLPFALTLLREAGNLTAGPALPGAVGSVQQFESVWPKLEALLDVPSQNAPVDIATDSGITALVLAPRDTPLGAGRRFARSIATDQLLRDARAVRMPTNGISAEILMRDGAEQAGAAWQGWQRVTGGLEGTMSWSGYADTLVSPSIPVAGRSGLTLFFWTRHGGSVFQQSSRGRVQLSVDNLNVWTTVAQVVGAAPEWYAVATTLDGFATGASSLRLRFIADSMPWSIDAVALTAGDASVDRLFASGSTTRASLVETSANPVRAAPVVLRWPAGTSDARVEVFSLTGTRVVAASLGADPGRWAWDLKTESGDNVANGAYYIVITTSDGRRMGRRLLVAR